MVQSRLSYIDLSVEDALRGYVLSGRAALLLARDNHDVLWANADGARLLGASSLRQLLDGEGNANPAIMRQIQAAASQLDHREETAAMVRARLGFKTQLVALGLTPLTLSNGETAVLVVSDEMHGRRYAETDMAQAAVEGLDGFGHASAVIGNTGEIIAASDKFAMLDLSAEQLTSLTDEMASEDDRLIKRMLTTPGGDIAIGLARLADSPARHLLIVADGDGDGELNAAPAAAEAEPAIEEDAAPDTAEEEDDAAPIVGAFSNRRSTTQGMGRWYYKAPKADANETDDAPADTQAEDAAESDESQESSIGAVTAAAVTAAAAAAAATAVASSSEEVSTDETTASDEDTQNESDVAPERVSAVHKPTPPMALVAEDADETSTDSAKPELDEKPADSGETSNTDAEEGDAELVDASSESDEDQENASEEEQPDDEVSAKQPEAEIEDAEPVAASIATDLEPDTEDKEADGFRFASAARPVRFTWATGPDKAFSAVSAELANTVGPRASAIDDMEWSQVSEKLGFENGDVIDELLDKGDTWSNRTVLWPVDGTDLRVPVDLAGLPSYDTARSFRGFNGFGIIRTADAMVDDTLVEDAEDETDNDLRQLGSDYEGGENDEANADHEIASNVTAPIGFLKPFSSDTKTDEANEPETSTSDTETTRVLSSDETSNFRQIGETLTDNAAKATDDEEAESAADSFVPSAFANRAIAEPNVEPETEEDNSSSAETDSESKAVPKTDRANVDTSILSRLPIPVLVYRDDELLFGNDEFFSTTGYADLPELAERGGVAALFADADAKGTSPIRHRDGHDLNLHGNLQSVPWDSEKAMLLTLRHTPPGNGNSDDRGGDEGGKGNGPAPAPSSNDRGSRSEPREADRTNVMPFPRLAARGSDVVEDEVAATTSKNPLSPEVAARDILSLQVEEARQRMNLRGDGETPSTSDTTSPTREASPHFTGMQADDLRAILDVSTDGVIIVSNEGVVRDINRSAEALFDVDAEAIAHRSITRLLAPESHRTALDYLANMGATGVASLLNDGREVVGKTSQGGLVPLFMTVGQLQHSDDCCAVVRDITHWKKAEEELLTTKAAAEGANELKTQFLAKISHEIRTPLNAIIGFSEMMIEERLGRIDNDRYRGYLRDINRSGAHVLDLVNDLLDITKIEAGKMEMDFDAVDLNRTVSENVAILQAEANADRIIIRTSLSTVVPKVVADQRSMRQIVLNLVSNSIKFTKSGGQVIVSTVYEDSGEVVLRVRDTGVGMSASEMEQALQPFRQTASAAVSATKGTGLGLPLTKALVEANRADFHIESTPDEGTLVEIHFPVQRVLADR
ncbi:HAMP domain-containing sensor histidine kinase [Ahrensia sp. R2A130]|uniref:sensor histidine kinase n=1 Tax=Ahrensia sp. R2A130 TaxID=744979 RepID=UPI0001E08C60|nr:HAMP domain-containing sensor histidine kinase [Ahrensia sp. R2A130]EFL88522.1 PAS/PAC sensor signal transduction histidine kinase [Ahrensia sp. R2A130]